MKVVGGVTVSDTFTPTYHNSPEPREEIPEVYQDNSVCDFCQRDVGEGCAKISLCTVASVDVCGECMKQCIVEMFTDGFDQSVFDSGGIEVLDVLGAIYHRGSYINTHAWDGRVKESGLSVGILPERSEGGQCEDH